MARLGSRFNITVLFIVLVYADPVRVRANTPAHTHVDLIVVAVGLVGATIGIAILFCVWVSIAYAMYHFNVRSTHIHRQTRQQESDTG